VHRQRGLRQPGQYPDGHRAPTEVRARPPVRADGPHGDQRPVVVGLGAHLVRDGERGGVRREPAFDDRAPCPVGHPGRLGPPAAEQRQPGDHHRLAGTGLPGQHGEARVELQRGVVDHAETLDPHLGQHGPSLRVR
jgi:hypothetical protein